MWIAATMYGSLTLKLRFREKRSEADYQGPK